MDETLQCGRSKESYWTSISIGTVYYAVQFWAFEWNHSTFWKLFFFMFEGLKYGHFQ